jgi:type III pantothenate kinase
MNLAIDIGNTQIKLGVYKDHKLIYKEIYSKNELYKSIYGISKKYQISNAILSSVGEFFDENELLKIRKLFNLHILSGKTKLPFINNYKTPKSLGVDRIALIAGAISLYPNKNVLVFDAGTCLTYDFINDKKEYYGGGISPGIEMRYKSLNSFTANLPKLSAVDNIPSVGSTTENAIHLGVLNGIIREIEGVINIFKAKNQKLTVVLTGGDTIFLAKNIKSTIFANPNFLLEGLNSILIYNLYK